MLWIIVVGAAWAIVSAVSGYLIGLSRSKARERERASSLCVQALRGRWSGSVRRILNAIDSGRRELPSEAEFYGPRYAEKLEGLPPDVLADALQDRVTPTSGKLLSSNPVRKGEPAGEKGGAG